jgi:hypothetical protein
MFFACAPSMRTSVEVHRWPSIDSCTPVVAASAVRSVKLRLTAGTAAICFDPTRRLAPSVAVRVSLAEQARERTAEVDGL